MRLIVLRKCMPRQILEPARPFGYIPVAMRGLLMPRLSKWPFLLGEVLLLGLAFLVCAQGHRPLGAWELFTCTLCVTVGAGCALLPFLLEYRVLTRLLVAEQLASATADIQKLEQFAGQIRHATGLWQTVQESADKTAKNAGEIADRMAAQMKDFNEFVRSANEGEKAALRLEVDKLRRAEADWLQVLVRMLDHTYALHRAALRSGQPTLVDQLGQFQHACRDAARRVGLAPFVAAPAEPFDAQRHQLSNADLKPAADAVVAETLATGYTYQGRILRPALVSLRNGSSSVSTPDSDYR
jgi:molecular chaperone GrpE (heat shock protein)